MHLLTVCRNGGLSPQEAKAAIEAAHAFVGDKTDWKAVFRR